MSRKLLHISYELLSGEAYALTGKRPPTMGVRSTIAQLETEIENLKADIMDARQRQEATI